MLTAEDQKKTRKKMPTKAPQAIYSPESIKNQARPVIELANRLLGEVLHFGLTLFGRCSSLGGGDEDLPILFVYQHLLEMLDSVAVQISECAPSPAALQLRAMFEALLTLEYITRDKTNTHERAMS